MADPHTELVNKILTTYGALPQLRIRKRATGVARSLDGRRIIKFGSVGAADIEGFLAGGLHIECEVKTGKATLDETQKNFRSMCLKYGVLHIVARCPEDFGNAICSVLQITHDQLMVGVLGAAPSAGFSQSVHNNGHEKP